MKRLSTAMAAALFCTLLSAGESGPTPSGEPDGLRQYRLRAETHQQASLTLLSEAQREHRHVTIEQARRELQSAQREYVGMLRDGTPTLAALQLAAAGLVATGDPLGAIDVMLDRPEADSDPHLLRIRADALLMAGDGRGAALAYENWVGKGDCQCFYRLWPGEPRRTGQGLSLIRGRAKGGPCSYLPPELRARLETLYGLYQHPDNLPKKNFETFPPDTY